MLLWLCDFSAKLSFHVLNNNATIFECKLLFRMKLKIEVELVAEVGKIILNLMLTACGAAKAKRHKID